MIVASFVMGLFTYILLQFMQLQTGDQSFFSTFPKFVIITGLSFAVYIWIGKMFDLDEVEPILKKVSAILFKSFGRKRQD